MKGVFTTESPDETEELGRRLAAALKPGDVVALTGELGSGKTRFVQGIALGLGHKGYTKSPSFTILNIYQGESIELYHIDLYRVSGPRELDDLGLEEYIYGQGVCVIEWADRAEGALPDHALAVRFLALGESTRRIEIGVERAE